MLNVGTCGWHRSGTTSQTGRPRPPAARTGHDTEAGDGDDAGHECRSAAPATTDAVWEVAFEHESFLPPGTSSGSALADTAVARSQQHPADPGYRRKPARSRTINVVMPALLAPPLVDRTEEQALLAGLAKEVCEAPVVSVLIEGEAGIGKSRVIAEVVAHAEGLRQQWWGAAEVDDDRPFAALADALGCRRHGGRLRAA